MSQIPRPNPKLVAGVSAAPCGASDGLKFSQVDVLTVAILTRAVLGDRRSIISAQLLILKGAT